MKNQSLPTGIRKIIVIAVVALLLLGGIGITGVAAQSAIPGDALYSVKTSIEETRLSLAKDAGDRVQMKLDFAEQRLEELSMLIKEGRNNEIKGAVFAFETTINSALLELETVRSGDPAQADELAKEITSALTRYAQTLSDLAINASDSIKDDVYRALDSTHLASSLDISSDDDSNTNESEIGDDNGIDNADINANDNGDDHGNDNVSITANNNTDDNSNISGNVNSNSNINGIADDNSNTSTNVNGNANSNTNADDSSNSNSNDSSSGSGKGGG